MNTSDDQNILSHTKKLGNSQFQVYCKSNPQTSHLIFSIQKYLKNFPTFYYNSLLMINKGRSLETLQKRLKLQYQNLLSEKSFYHLIYKALISREKCIQKIKRDLTKAHRILTIFKKQYIQPNSQRHLAYLQYVEQQGYSNVQVDQTVQNSIKLISGIFVDMSRLRDMTLYVVETIHKWKFQIEQWIDKCNQYEPLFFIHNGLNAYDIIIQDTKFIWESALQQYIFLDCKNDPFLIRNVLQVEERKQKTILEKYFIQILYPKSQQIVIKSVKCYQMLTFKYQPQTNNLYYQEQLLIQNYLSLQKKQEAEQGIEEISQNQFQWEDKMKKEKRNRLNPKGWIFGNTLKKPHTQRVKEIVQRHTNRITFIKPFNINNYSQKKSLALAFLADSNKIIKQKNQHQTQNPRHKEVFKAYRSRSSKQIKRNSQPKKQSNFNSQKGYKSQNQVLSKNRISKIYQSLSKISPVIMQDPYQDYQTPKNIKKQNQKKKKFFQNNFFSQSQSQPIKSKEFKSLNHEFNNKNNHSESENDNEKIMITHRKSPIKIKGIKFNSIINLKNKEEQKQKSESKQEKLLKLQINKVNFESDGEPFKIQNFNNEPNNQQNKNKKLQNQPINSIKNEQDQKSYEKISIEQQEKQLNLNDFLTNFRSTTVKIKKKQINNERINKVKHNQQKLLTIKQLIQQNKLKGLRNSRSKSLVAGKEKNNNIFNIKSKLPLASSKHIKQNQEKLNKSRSQNSFVEYQNQVADRNQPKVPFKFYDDFIILNSKTIPIDIIPKYLRHVFAQVHSTSKKFTLYSYDQLLKKLEDPYVHCIIFDVSTQKKGHIGQVILSQNTSFNNQKLKYTIQFINIHVFQLIVATVLRIAQEMLFATPCQQVICPLIEDKLDPVSSHFIDLIESAFKMKVNSFGNLSILQKKKLYYKNSDLHQRLYIFSTKNRKQHELKISKAMIGNYRSLKFQSKCLLLASNFRMRGKTVAKNVISNYDSVSLGYMYLKVLDKILTKFHLRQIKTASVSSNDTDQTVSLVKQNSFLRTQITALNKYLKQQNLNENNLVHLTKFENMSQVLTYLDYKQYSQYFHFNFLQESRFILNHQLYISEIDIQLSLEFLVRTSIDFLILYNYHNLTLKIIQPNNEIKAKGIILPTTNDDLDLILIDGKQYQDQTTDKLDLFSYLYIYQNQIKNNYKQLIGLKEIIIPTIHQNTKNLNSVRLFDGLFRLFPQRQFYSGNYFKCHNMWQSYFPSAVVYKPSQQAFVLQYPLIVGYLNKQTNQIITAFVLRENTI